MTTTQELTPTLTAEQAAANRDIAAWHAWAAERRAAARPFTEAALESALVCARAMNASQDPFDRADRTNRGFCIEGDRRPALPNDLWCLAHRDLLRAGYEAERFAWYERLGKEGAGEGYKTAVLEGLYGACASAA